MVPRPDRLATRGLSARPVDLNKFSCFVLTMVPIGSLCLLIVIQDFGTAVFEKHDPSPAPEEAVKTLEILDALAKSARSGQLEKV